MKELAFQIGVRVAFVVVAAAVSFLVSARLAYELGADGNRMFSWSKPSMSLDRSPT